MLYRIIGTYFQLFGKSAITSMSVYTIFKLAKLDYELAVENQLDVKPLNQETIVRYSYKFHSN